MYYVDGNWVYVGSIVAERVMVAKKNVQKIGVSIFCLERGVLDLCGGGFVFQRVLR